MPTESAALRDWPCTNPDHAGLCFDGHVHADHVATLPVIFDIEAMDYGDILMRQLDDGRIEVVGDVPQRCAFSTHLLESADDSYLTWDGKRITATLANGTWSWDAEAQNLAGNVIYGGPTNGT